MHTRRLEIEPGISGGSPGALFPWIRGAVFFTAFLAALALPVVAPTQEQEARETALRVAHLSPDAPEVDIYVDDEPVDTLSEVSFKSVSPYLEIPSGTRNVKVYTATDPEPLLEANMDLDSEDSYTLAVVGLQEDDSLAARLYEDDDSPAEGDDARLRVVHAVPDVGAATVGVEGDEDLFALPGFSNASDYVDIPAGTHTLEVKPAGTDEVALSVPDVTLLAGEVYTAFAVGQAADATLDAVLVSDSASDSRVLLGAGGQREPLDAEETDAEELDAEELVAVGGGLDSPETGGFEAEAAPILDLPGYPASVGDVVTGLSELFDEAVPDGVVSDEVAKIEPEPVFQQPAVQFGATEVLDPAPSTTTTAPRSLPYQAPTRTNKDKDDRPENLLEKDAPTPRPARAVITPTGVSASAGGASATVRE